MIFDLGNLNPPTKFFFDDDNTDAGYLELRVCNGESLRDIEKKTVKIKVDYHKGSRHEYAEVNNDLRDEMIWDYSITGWAGVYGIDNEPIEPNKENKALLMRGSAQFATLYVSGIEKLNKGISEKREALEKN